MSNSNNVPCTNPTLCGVKSHRPGTLAKCQQAPASKSGPASGNLSSTPKLGSESSAPKVELSAEGEALLERALLGKTKEVVVRNDNGTQIIMAINDSGDKGDLFDSTDQAVNARIKTASGVKVYAADYGGRANFEFKDGGTANSWVYPVTDDGGDLSSEITLAEFQALESASGIAYEAGYVEEVDPDGSLSEADRNREAVRRVLALRDEAGIVESPLPDDAQDLSDLAKEAIEHDDTVVDYYRNNIVGQYLDQVLQGKGVENVDKITEPDFVGGDDDVERIWGLSDEDEYDWDDYNPAIEELQALGAKRAQEWLKQNIGTEEFGEWVAARARHNQEIKGTHGGHTYGLQQDWAENPLGDRQYNPYG